jgi:hypothetical protein
MLPKRLFYNKHKIFVVRPIFCCTTQIFCRPTNFLLYDTIFVVRHNFCVSCKPPFTVRTVGAPTWKPGPSSGSRATSSPPGGSAGTTPKASAWPGVDFMNRFWPMTHSSTPPPPLQKNGKNFKHLSPQANCAVLKVRKYNFTSAILQVQFY